jgi:hypothetical protein
MWFRSALKQMHGLLGADQDEVDPLVALVRHEPTAATRFLQVLMLGGSILSAVVCTICWCLLYFRWRECASCCDRPLRLWLCVHTGLQQCQVPVRLYFSAKIHSARRDAYDDSAYGASLEACVASFTASPLWRCARFGTMITYGWLALGIVWVINSKSCDAGCLGGLRFTCIMMICIIGLRAVFAAELFHMLFGSGNVAQPSAQDCLQQPEGASPAEVSALPCACYREVKRADTHGTSHTGCVVCYSEYAEKDMLRILPCGHHFHQKCVDIWLQRSTRCPLCMGSIRKEPGDSSCTDQCAGRQE